MSPPLPPLPPSGPPYSIYFSRRNDTAPGPPSPDLMKILAWSRKCMAGPLGRELDYTSSYVRVERSRDTDRRARPKGVSNTIDANGVGSEDRLRPRNKIDREKGKEKV